MLSYKEEQSCIKCGNDAITERFDTGCRLGNFEPEDHIIRHCVNCGYKWNVKTLDAE